MSARTTFVIVISGPSGAGKTTLAEKIAARLGSATMLSYDAYWQAARWHADIVQWVEQGCDPNRWTSLPNLVADVRALREGHTIVPPGGVGPIEPAPYLVLEEPWGRDREELRPWIDFVVHIMVPLDISLCRKLLREYAVPSPGHDPLDLVRDYLSLRLGEIYRRQQQVAEHADLIVDGLRPPDELAAHIVERIQQARGEPAAAEAAGH